MPEQVPATRRETALWLLEKMVPGNGVNNLSFALEVDGRLDPEVLRRAVAAIVDRHDVLRTVFRADDESLTRDVLEPGEIALPVRPVAHSGDVQADLTAFVAEPFSFDARPLVRAGHWSDGTRDVFCLVTHHLIADAMSTALLQQEFVEAYSAIAAGTGYAPGRVPPTPEAPSRPASLAYWRQALAGLEPAPAGLWCAHPEPVEPTLAARIVEHPLSPAAREAVRRLQRELRAPEAVVLLAGYQLLLHAHGAGRDIVVGSPFNVRDLAGPPPIGYHANLLPLRVAVDPSDTFRALVRRTRGVFFDAMAHADAALETITPDLPNTAPSAWRSSFFRYLFNYLPAPPDTPVEVGGHPARRLPVENGFSRFDLEFFVTSAADVTHIRAAYCVQAIDQEDVRLLLDRYDALLASLGAVIERPLRELTVWAPRDRAVIDGAHRPATGPPATTVPDGVRDAVVATPDAVAVEDGDRTVRYRELWSLAGATGEAVGTDPGVVAVSAPRSAGLAAAVLGVWRAGGSVLALDPAQDPAEAGRLLSTADATCLVTDDPLGPLATAFAGRVLPLPNATGGAAPSNPTADPAASTAAAPGRAVDAEAVALLTYPVDGEPAPAALTHAGLAAAVAGRREAQRATAVLWLTSVAAGQSLLELLAPLATGGRVVVAADPARDDPALLGALLERHHVDLVPATPTRWRRLVEPLGTRLAGRHVLAGPQPLPPTLDTDLARAGCRVHHGYGPAGYAGDALVASAPADGAPAGPAAPVTGVRAFVSAPDGRELPVGVRGELCLAGPGVPAGYPGRPNLDAERIGEHPSYGRFLRTGELARWRPDGRLELLGAVRREVVLDGRRIRLPEVEATLAGHPEVVLVAVVPTTTPRPGLIAYVESAGKPGLAERLGAYAARNLPSPAVPVRIDVRDALPTTLADTIDLARLERQAAEGHGAADASAEPDELTATLVALWRELLDEPALEADANFFMSGGHSLLGAQLVQRIKKTTGLPVRLADLFANPTPEDLARHLRLLDDEDDGGPTA
ncbi:condensation domain-containing protein [Micromonospora sp. WMMD1082]|uniref:condensation domain-containing protein n=1 Tax=Micromonospora sp. WMMD1082 TaxID=3016104 RepID=UPI002417F3EE|nr:condensation domain-containing protein [Micromonospora sp. WMMD1082]MDG4794556.1 AMP-binding protein [Micromonospora sp. WMMD1082]